MRLLLLLLLLMELEPMLTPEEKIPLPDAQRRIERATLHHVGQRVQHTGD